MCGNFSSFTAPSQRCRSCPYSFVSVFSFFFCPTPVHGEFLAFWEVWGLLPAFSRCSVEVVPHVEVFLMYLWWGRWSPCLTPLPSWRSPPGRWGFYVFVTDSYFYPFYILDLEVWELLREQGHREGPSIPTGNVHLMHLMTSTDHLWVPAELLPSPRLHYMVCLWGQGLSPWSVSLWSPTGDLVHMGGFRCSVWTKCPNWASWIITP